MQNNIVVHLARMHQNFKPLDLDSMGQILTKLWSVPAFAHSHNASQVGAHSIRVHLRIPFYRLCRPCCSPGQCGTVPRDRGCQPIVLEYEGIYEVCHQHGFGYTTRCRAQTGWLRLHILHIVWMVSVTSCPAASRKKLLPS